MSITRVEQVKKRKPFALWDLLVYGVIAAVIVILFAVFVFAADNTTITGVRIEREGTLLYTYTFGSGGEVVPAGEGLFEEQEKDGVVYVTVYQDTRHERYNILEINPNARTVKMHETNCSRHKDCMYMEEISTVSQVIVCVPHGLKILALNAKENYKPIIG